MTLAEEKVLLDRFAKAAGAGEMLNIHDLKAAYEEAIGLPTSDSTVYNVLLGVTHELWTTRLWALHALVSIGPSGAGRLSDRFPFPRTTSADRVADHPRKRYHCLV
jgi:hypothetical protein